MQILKQTEADSKNIFGYYSSQRMKDWLEIVKMYEKDNVYLGMCGQSLTCANNVFDSRKRTDSHT